MYNIPHFNSLNNNLHNTYLFVLRCIVHLSFRFIYISVPFNLLYLFFSIFFLFNYSSFYFPCHFVYSVYRNLHLPDSRHDCNVLLVS